MQISLSQNALTQNIYMVWLDGHPLAVDFVYIYIYINRNFFRSLLLFILYQPKHTHTQNSHTEFFDEINFFAMILKLIYDLHLEF